MQVTIIDIVILAYATTSVGTFLMAWLEWLERKTLVSVAYCTASFTFAWIAYRYISFYYA